MCKITEVTELAEQRIPRQRVSDDQTSRQSLISLEGCKQRDRVIPPFVGFDSSRSGASLRLSGGSGNEVTREALQACWGNATVRCRAADFRPVTTAITAEGVEGPWIVP